jgi:hypothetical protein
MLTESPERAKGVRMLTLAAVLKNSIVVSALLFRGQRCQVATRQRNAVSLFNRGSLQSGTLTKTP